MKKSTFPQIDNVQKGKNNVQKSKKIQEKSAKIIHGVCEMYI